MAPRLYPFASDLVATLKYRLIQIPGSRLIHNLQPGHAAVLFEPSLALVLLDSYLAPEEIERDEDGDPMDLDEDGTHDPKLVYATIVLPNKELKKEFSYRDSSGLIAFLEESLKPIVPDFSLKR